MNLSIRLFCIGADSGNIGGHIIMKQTRKSQDSFSFNFVQLHWSIFRSLGTKFLQFYPSSTANPPPLPLGGGGGDLVPTMPECVCPKVNDMGPFSASGE